MPAVETTVTVSIYPGGMSLEALEPQIAHALDQAGCKPLL